MLIATIGLPRKRCVNSEKTWLFVECDHCSKRFLIKNGSKLSNERHYCKLACVNAAQRGDGELANVKRAVFIERYGVPVPAKNSAVLAKMQATSADRYGGWPQQNKLIAAKRIETCKSRYGVESAFQLQNTRERCNSPSACQKRHDTMKKNGSYNHSCSEDRFYEALCQRFGATDVERQVAIDGTRWAIDFLIVSKGVYVQFDGAYWHGLRSPIAELRASMSERDAALVHKWDTDRAQDAWFQAQQKRLVRITDVAFTERGVDVLEDLQ